MWDGARFTERYARPYKMNIEIRPAPAGSLDSLESGRLILMLQLRNAADVRKVWAKLFNKARWDRLDSIEGRSKLKTKTSVLTELTKQPNLQGQRDLSSWIGEICIPITWTEGASNSIERTGAFTLTENEELFSLEISCLSASGVRRSARLGSQDAYHWPSA